MKFAILGAGAMGSMVGGLLAQADHDVTLVDINESHVAAVERAGLQMRSERGRDFVRLRATTTPQRDLDAVDAVVVLCKSWATTTAATGIKHACHDKTVVVTLQNGLGNDRALKGVLQDCEVLAGSTTAGAVLCEPGVVALTPATARRESLTEVAGSGSGERDAERAAALCSVLTEAGLPCEVRPDGEAIVWSKIALAAASGPVTALFGITLSEMLANSTALSLAAQLFDETMLVAQRVGVILERDVLWAHALSTYSAAGAHTTSMAADFAAFRRSEIDAFCVEIARTAKEHGVTADTHRIVGQILVGREQIAGIRPTIDDNPTDQRPQLQ